MEDLLVILTLLGCQNRSNISALVVSSRYQTSALNQVSSAGLDAGKIAVPMPQHDNGRSYSIQDLKSMVRSYEQTCFDLFSFASMPTHEISIIQAGSFEIET